MNTGITETDIQIEERIIERKGEMNLIENQSWSVDTGSPTTSARLAQSWPSCRRENPRAPQEAVLLAEDVEDWRASCGDCAQKKLSTTTELRTAPFFKRRDNLKGANSRMIITLTNFKKRTASI
ncbi:hypothetical protein T12_12223 [Trichinella patagoniensis]|uniref:Uncharacterized protein n=1 Tax=Trichinella patagoniensis TaxID=990121 RepID=A0A0V0Z0T9_9BILA|nr:hypothetical protein T12_12223 [Trichinella patagoniensis]